MGEMFQFLSIEGFYRANIIYNLTMQTNAPDVHSRINYYSTLITFPVIQRKSAIASVDNRLYFDSYLIFVLTVIIHVFTSFFAGAGQIHLQITNLTALSINGSLLSLFDDFSLFPEIGIPGPAQALQIRTTRLFIGGNR